MGGSFKRRDEDEVPKITKRLKKDLKDNAGHPYGGEFLLSRREAIAVLRLIEWADEQGRKR